MRGAFCASLGILGCARTVAATAAGYQILPSAETRVIQGGNKQFAMVEHVCVWTGCECSNVSIILLDADVDPDTCLPDDDPVLVVCQDHGRVQSTGIGAALKHNRSPSQRLMPALRYRMSPTCSAASRVGGCKPSVRFFAVSVGVVGIPERSGVCVEERMVSAWRNNREASEP